MVGWPILEQGMLGFRSVLEGRAALEPHVQCDADSGPEIPWITTDYE